MTGHLINVEDDTKDSSTKKEIKSKGKQKKVEVKKNTNDALYVMI